MVAVNEAEGRFLARTLRVGSKGNLCGAPGEIRTFWLFSNDSYRPVDKKWVLLARLRDPASPFKKTAYWDSYVSRIMQIDSTTEREKSNVLATLAAVRS